MQRKYKTDFALKWLELKYFITLVLKVFWHFPDHPSKIPRLPPVNGVLNFSIFLMNEHAKWTFGKNTDLFYAKFWKRASKIIYFLLSGLKSNHVFSMD